MAAECCYGGELYDPSTAQGQMGICNTYLANQAYGFFGSTTIAYGPSSGNDNADLLCQYFLQSVLQGASIGRAALEARQKFLQVASMSDPFNVKTIAQFNLYGDPALSPIRAVAPHAMPAPDGTPKGGRIATARMERTERRRDLFLNGLSLGDSQSLITRVKAAPSTSVQEALRKTARTHQMTPSEILTFDVQPPASTKSLPKGLGKEPGLPTRVHVVFAGGTRKSPTETTTTKSKAAPTRKGTDAGIVKIEALVVREVNGKIISATKVVSR